MTIRHHPADSLLLAYSGGTLDAAAHAALATHLSGCRQCRDFAVRAEELGGQMLDSAPAETMAADAFGKVAALLDVPEPTRSEPKPAAPATLDAPGLPPFVRRLAAGKWRRIAPGLALQPLTPPAQSETRLFLLRARPGMRLMAHGHSALELTCVLQGSFSHDGERYGTGDFDTGDGEADHAIAIGSECECLCLVALRGKLEFRGLAGRLVQPFIAI